MSLGVDIFNDLYDALEDARVRVRIGGRTVIAEALSAGITLADDNTDEGILIESDGAVQYRFADEPTPRVVAGDVIEIKAPHQTKYRRVRANDRLDLAGVVTINVRAEFA